MTNHSHNHDQHPDKGIAESFNEDIVKKYIDLFNRLPIGIYRTTPDGKILTANPAFLSMLGYSMMDDLEGIDLNKTHKNPEARQDFKSEIEEKGELYAKESVIVTVSGKEIAVEEYAKVYRNEQGEVLFYEGIVIDITPMKNDAARINYLNQMRELIFNITTSFINIRIPDIDDQIVYSLKRIGSFMGADRAYVFLFDDEEMTSMSNTHEWVTDGVDSVINDQQELPTAHFKWWMDNLRKNKAIIVNDINQLPAKAEAEQSVFHDQDINSLFSVPMFFEYRLIGFLGFDFVRKSGSLQEEVLELLDIVSGLFASILNYQQTEQEVINQQKEIETRLEKLERELADANRRLKFIGEGSNDVLWMMDMNLKTNYMSRSVEKQLGYTVEEYLAMPVEERLPPESVKKAQAVFLAEIEKLQKGEISDKNHSVIYEMLHRHKSGELIWGEVSFSFLFDENGDATGIHGITRNIHERKMTEFALWNLNERYKSLLENTTDFIWEIDERGNYTYVNSMCKSLFGYTPAEMEGRHFSDFIELSQQSKARAFYDNMVNARLPFKNYDNTGIHKNGKRVFLETSGVPVFDMNGKYAGFRGIDRDVSEKKEIETTLKKSQSKLKQYLINFPMAYIEWDKGLEVIEWNPAAQQLFGFSRSEAMVGNIVSSILPTKASPELTELFKNIFKDGKPLTITQKCLTKNQETKDCEWFITPVFNEDNSEVVSMITLIREIK
jgi:PAS domain S-box-containing protein